MTRNRHIQLLTIEYAANARGVGKTHSYEQARGLLLGTTYSDGTTARAYTYNHLGQLTQVTDDAGVRTIGYNAYGEQETDSLLAGDVTHLISESRDAVGRSTGFTYAKNGTVQHTVTTGYGADGRITTAGFLHGGAEKQFGYGYLSGSNLLQTLTMPCNMTLTQSYETQRNLLTGMDYRRGTTLVTQRTFSYDTLGRPLTRSTARNGQTVNDSFVHNSRSELVSATVNGFTYGYDYDNIGNRRMATEASDYTLYEANNLNQYTSIQENEDSAFVPIFDADGNQTLVKTATGIWSVVYNAENRPIRFTSEDETIVIECAYDFMGRRVTKKVIINGSITLHQRYIYRGYLQIACCDLTRSGHPCLWLLTWDPSQPVATRPLAIRKDGTWYAYGWDPMTNVCEVFGPAGYIRTMYTYTPYGNVTEHGDVKQPLQWSSEFYESELSRAYYNYRHYSSQDGRWISRDDIGEKREKNLYNYVKGQVLKLNDHIGRSALVVTAPAAIGAAAADGPLPIGDIIGAGLIIGALIIDLVSPSDDDISIIPEEYVPVEEVEEVVDVTKEKIDATTCRNRVTFLYNECIEETTDPITHDVTEWGLECCKKRKKLYEAMCEKGDYPLRGELPYDPCEDANPCPWL